MAACGRHALRKLEIAALASPPVFSRLHVRLCALGSVLCGVRGVLVGFSMFFEGEVPKNRNLGEKVQPLIQRQDG